MSQVISREGALECLLANFRKEQRIAELPSGVLMTGPSAPGDYLRCQAGAAVEAFAVLAEKLAPADRCQFSLYLSAQIAPDAPLQSSVTEAFARSVASMKWQPAYMVLDIAHRQVRPGQPLYGVVVDQLRDLEARSEAQSRPAVAQLLQAMTERAPVFSS